MKARYLLMFGLFLGAAAPALFAAPAGAQESKAPRHAKSKWTASMAEHLWNRAGFGATSLDIEHALELGQAAFVKQLLSRPGRAPAFMPDHVVGRKRGRSDAKRRAMDAEQRKAMRQQMRRSDREQAQDYGAWWVGRMLTGQDPLGERMTLFWHGHFTSSMEDVRNSFAMINQSELFRELGLGQFGELLGEVARDPAMLEYLDNKSNKRDSPNENFARELLELFTLGEGEYTEQDIKEAARAFTGWSERGGEFVLLKRQHDGGAKTFLGQQGELGGEEVLEIILEQKACARYIAGKLITYFEGVVPSAKRLTAYARAFRKSDLHVGQLLERLFMDPAFYRSEVIGGRIAAPIDLMVGNARRLGLDAPAELVLVGSGILGQRLFNPPNVKGWDGGTAWISSSSLIHRGNLAGVLLGEISLRDFLDYDPAADEEMNARLGMDELPEMEMEGKPMGKRAQIGELRGLRTLRGSRWRPRLKLALHVMQDGARKDNEVVASLVGRLLGVSVGPETRAMLTRRLTEQRKRSELGTAAFLRDPILAEPVLRELAHLILSLPEAQLN